MLQNVYHNKVVTPHLTSGQDGGVGRYALVPRTPKEGEQQTSKQKNDQNCQKIELYGNPTIKELKKKHSSRLVGGVRWAARVERTCSKAVDWEDEAAAGRLGSPTFVCK